MIPGKGPAKAPTGETTAPGSSEYIGTTKKIFIGGLAPGTTEDYIKTFFTNQYGAVEDVVFMYDRETHKPRGFGFVTFESEETVEKVVKEHFIEIKGKRVECKKALPRPGEKGYVPGACPPKSSSAGRGRGQNRGGAQGYGAGRGGGGGGYNMPNQNYGYGQEYSQGYSDDYRSYGQYSYGAQQGFQGEWVKWFRQ
jgi:RNA recognition motif-containing protein